MQGVHTDLLGRGDYGFGGPLKIPLSDFAVKLTHRRMTLPCLNDLNTRNKQNVCKIEGLGNNNPGMAPALEAVGTIGALYLGRALFLCDEVGWREVYYPIEYPRAGTPSQFT